MEVPVNKFFLLLLIFSNLSFAANEEKILKLKKISEPIKIDGIIDPLWAVADSVSDFVQSQPYHNEKPSKLSIAKVLTTENALYCLIVCYDDFENIQKTTGKLDDFGGDFVSIMLDTFGDKRSAYKLGVSASGVRTDARLLDDARNRDYNWDGIWFADSKIYNWGFVIEMEIPYKSIQYDENLTEWGLDFDRWIPTKNEDIYWCAYEQNEGQRISKFGKLIFDDFKPSTKGLNLEIYPVGIAKATLKDNGKYDVDPDAGLDIFYNPSPKLTFQFTANPDFAQIEADPFDFNISRFESYFDERRPFFTEGAEVFTASGRERSSGFYRPLELFYPRRIGKKLPDGQEVPLNFGAKAFGRFDDLEYGGFVARTGEIDYVDDDTLNLTEQDAYFASARIKKQIYGNSSIGALYVGKYTAGNTYGVIDIDGAFRESDWQLAYQIARSFKNNDGDFALSAGYRLTKENWVAFIRGRYIGNNFDIEQIGYVPWIGTSEIVALTGPRWFYKEGAVSSMMMYFGGSTYYEKEDEFMDYSGIFGWNMQFRNNWGFEINLSGGKSKDDGIEYTSYEANFSSWYNISAKWDANLYGGYSKTYNFDREYLSFYSWLGGYIDWKAFDILNLGTSYDMYVEGDPDNNIADITNNARPYFSLTPINDLNIKVYVDNVFIKSVDRLDQVVFGLFFAYNFSPKSWIYFALNEIRDRSEEYDQFRNVLPRKMHVTDRAAVMKLKYLYYF